MPKQRALFLDRDGVINEERGYVGSREQFVFMPGLFPFLRTVQGTGYRLVIVTNQSGVARGFYTEDDYHKLTAWMLEEMCREGVLIDLVLACFEYEGATVEKYCRQSFWRKPNPGMILEAAQVIGVDLFRSVMIGDQDRDMQAAAAAGIEKRLLFEGNKKTQVGDGVVVVKDFEEALKYL